MVQSYILFALLNSVSAQGNKINKNSENIYEQHWYRKNNWNILAMENLFTNDIC